MLHPNYYRDTLDGQSVYRCCECQFDSFDRHAIEQHARYKHPAREVVEQLPPHSCPKVTIGFLTWNTAQASLAGAAAIYREVVNYPAASVAWIDNGSNDDTTKLVARALDGTKYSKFMSITNMGQSAARNWIIEQAIHNQSEYILFVDGDIEIIPRSVASMVCYLEKLPSEVACFGLLSSNCSDDRNDNIAPQMGRIENWMVRSSRIAWTQYGMFRVAPLRTIRFDESAFFQGPGWGFEDDDLYLQLVSQGFQVYHTPYFRYLHRSRNSSLQHMTPEFARAAFQERRLYVINKWFSHESVAIRTHVSRLSNQTFPSGKIWLAS